MKLLLMTFLLSTQLFSASLLKQDFADKITVNEKTLVLNGLGLRKATIFGVKVYIGALYLMNKMSDEKSIYKAQGPKKVVMHFVRDVDQEKLVNGFKEGLKDNGFEYDNHKKDFDELFSVMTDVKENDKLEVIYDKDTATMSFKGKSKTIKFPKASRLLALWIGNPPNDDLKEGMLGKAK